MQGAEIKDEGSVLKYMTKSEIDEQRSSLHIMTQRPFVVQKSNISLRNPNSKFCFFPQNLILLIIA